MSGGARPTHFVAIHLKSREIQRCVSGPRFHATQTYKRDCVSGREQLQQWFVAQDKLFERCLVRPAIPRLLDRSSRASSRVSGSDQTSAHCPFAYFVRGAPACCLDRLLMCSFLILPLQEPRVSEARQVCAEAPVFPGSNITRQCVRGVPQLEGEPASLSTRGINSAARDMVCCMCRYECGQLCPAHFQKINRLAASSRPISFQSNQPLLQCTRGRTRS